MKIANIEVQNLHIILRLMILWYYYHYDTIKLIKLTPRPFRFKNSPFHETPWLLLLLKVKNEGRRTTSSVFYEIYEILYKLF